MFDQIGQRIKTLAVVITVIGMIISVIMGCDYIFNKSRRIYGLIIIVGGIIASYIGSFILYGFGEIIDKLCDISKSLNEQKILAVAKEAENVNDGDKQKIKDLANGVIHSIIEENTEEENAEEENAEEENTKEENKQENKDEKAD